MNRADSISGTQPFLMFFYYHIFSEENKYVAIVLL